MIVGQVLDAVEDIGRVPQDVLQVLVGRVAEPGESAEGGHIAEIVPVEAADVETPDRAVGDRLGRGGNVRREMA